MASGGVESSEREGVGKDRFAISETGTGFADAKLSEIRSSRR
jgi:hypothetical protein